MRQAAGRGGSGRKAQRGEPAEHFGDAGRVDVGEGDAQLALADNAYPDMGRQIWDVGMAVHESNRQLAYALEEQLEKLILDGSVERLYAHYGLRYEKPESYQ